MNDTPQGEGPQSEARRPTPMEFGSLPLDPLYAWGMRLEPVETLIIELSGYIEELAKEQYEASIELGDDELERRFLDWFDARVADGTLRQSSEGPDPLLGNVLGPKRWIRAQRIRMRRLIAWWREHGGPDI